MVQLLMRRPHLLDLPTPPALPEGYEVRLLAGGADAPSLVETLRGAFGEQWTEETARELLIEADDVLAVYVATYDGSTVATASSRWVPDLYPGSGYVHWVGTHPDHVRLGLGTAVVGRVLQDFRDRGYRDAVLQTEDFRIPAMRSYLKLGFVPELDVEGEDHRDRWRTIFQTRIGL